MSNNKITKIVISFFLLFLFACTGFIFTSKRHYFAESFANNNVEFNNNFQNTKSQKKSQAKVCKVFITGEVKNPGVYEVALGTRAADAIKLAGGFTDAAKIEGVNLTRLLRDGMQIKVPALKKNEKNKNLKLTTDTKRKRSFKRPAKMFTDNGIFAQGAFVEIASHPEPNSISINTASERELIQLPCIHEELARRIIAHRKNHPFISKEELLNVSGINQRILNRIQQYIIL